MRMFHVLQREDVIKLIKEICGKTKSQLKLNYDVAGSF